MGGYDPRAGRRAGLADRQAPPEDRLGGRVLPGRDEYSADPGQVAGVLEVARPSLLPTPSQEVVDQRPGLVRLAQGDVRLGQEVGGGEGVEAVRAEELRPGR